MVWTFYSPGTLPEIDSIVWCRFPEVSGLIPGPKLRPVLVQETHVNLDGTKAALSVSYGTKNLKKQERWDKDLIIERMIERYYAGLKFPTRFDLDPINLMLLPWCSEFFDCPQGKKIVMGALTADGKRRLDNRLRKRGTASMPASIAGTAQAPSKHG